MTLLESRPEATTSSGFSIPKAPGAIVSGVVGREDSDKGRWYIRPSDQLVLESVTEILSLTGGGGFYKNWYAKLAGIVTVKHRDIIAKMFEGTIAPELRKEAEKKLKAANKENSELAVRDQAVQIYVADEIRKLSEIKADIGSYQHSVLEALVLDEPIPDVPEHLINIEVDDELFDVTTQDAISDGLLNFFNDFPNVMVLMAEATVANPAIGCAGTLDLILLFPDGLTIDGETYFILLVDLKAGKWLKDDMRAQLAAYRHATEVWLDTLGNTMPMPAVDGSAILHLRRDYESGYKLIIVDSGEEQFEWFCDRVKLLEKSRNQPKRFGSIAYPPLPDGSQPLPLIEDIDDVDGFSRYRKPLRSANLRRLDDLAHFTIDDLLAVKGIGEKAVEPITTAMAAYGLELVTAPTSASAAAGVN